MAFDPTLPAAHSLINSEELRNQFNGLQEQVAQRLDTTQVQMQIQSLGAQNPGSLETLDTVFNDPPTLADLEAVRAKLNELITALRWY